MAKSKKSGNKKSGAKKPSSVSVTRGLYKSIKTQKHNYQATKVAELLTHTDKERVEALSEAISAYIVKNLPEAIDRREGLSHYRTNPYVLLTSASVMKLTESDAFARFLFNTKLYMGLETSFGKSIESVLVTPYPLGIPSGTKWHEPPEKVAESSALTGLEKEERAQKRIDSVWREIDKSVIVGARRYLVSISSTARVPGGFVS